MVKCFFSDLTPAFSSASAAVSTCIRVSAVPPDFEMAMKWVFFRSKRFRAASQEKGSGLSWNSTTGPAPRRKAVRAWPPSEEPPIPSTATVLTPLMPAAALAAALRSSVREGMLRSSSTPRWPRSQSSARPASASALLVASLGHARPCRTKRDREKRGSAIFLIRAWFDSSRRVSGKRLNRKRINSCVQGRAGPRASPPVCWGVCRLGLRPELARGLPGRRWRHGSASARRLAGLVDGG